MKILERKMSVIILFIVSLFTGMSLIAQEKVLTAAEIAEKTTPTPMFTVNNTWMLVAVFLVFIMHLGFATLEVGLTRPKNTTNILFKNTAIVAIGFLTYALIGFSVMYPGTWLVGTFFGWTGWGLDAPMVKDAMGALHLDLSYNSGYTYWTDFMFQGMFAATAATIVSGAVAERIKLSSFLIFSAIYIAIIYPLVGSWGWGCGWLIPSLPEGFDSWEAVKAAGQEIPLIISLGGGEFHDFAGSTFVHSVGGWGALAGIILLGPRIGKYVKGKINAIPGHSMPLATIGVFLLWLGWFGFNGGSVLSADPGAVSYVFVTTFIASCAGIMGSMATTWIVHKKPDLSMVLNGCLAGLVGITAGADCVSITSSIIIGLIAGILVVLSVEFFDRIKIDDPVGATSVHLVCGIWGTLAVGIFSADYTILSQLIGIVAAGLICFPAALIVFGILKACGGIRVESDEELRGLDIGEHGMEAYPGFQIFTTQ